MILKPKTSHTKYKVKLRGTIYDPGQPSNNRLFTYIFANTN